MSGEMGVPPPPPPPPPPMPGPGAPMAGRPRPPQSSSLEPPAAIQVAMMGQSKDKKPFTYTPGGIDLSQIKSPRMARRICRNAASEGVSGPPPGAPTSNGQYMPPPPTAVPVFPPPVAVQVLPPPPPPPPQHRPPPAPQQMRPPLPPQQVRPPPPPMQMRPPMPPPQMAGPPRPLAEVLMGSLPQYQQQPQQQMMQQQQQQQPQMMQQRAPPPMRPVEVVRAVPSPTPPTPPPQMTSQSPMSPVPQQMRMEPMRSSPTPSSPMSPPPTGSIYIPVVMQQPPPPPQMPQVQPVSVVLNKTQGMPWMNSASQQQPPQSPMWTPPGNMSPGARVIPIQIEGRNSPLNFATQQRQQQQPQPQPTQQRQQQQPQPQQHYQQQPQLYQQPPQQYQQPQQQQQQYQQPQQYQQQQPQQYQQQQGAGVRVIPIQIEGRPPSTPVTSHRVQSPGVGGGWASPGPADNPTQSRSFRVLQRITSYDEVEAEPQSAPVSHSGPPPPAPMQQMRKMQLTNDDRALMDRFKAQEMSNGFSALKKPTRHVEPAVAESENLYFVDEDSSLHTEQDPRYRGAAIPSRAFKMLQTMTGPEGAASGDSGYQAQVHRAPAQQQQHQQQARVTSELYVPPSEQEVQPDPRKYTGSAIPSRSFRMLQAMTGTNQDENGLAYSEVPAEAMYYPPQSPCPSPYSWYYPPEGGSGDPVWDSYVYAYVQNYGHYPPQYYYPNGYESEHEYSGYSSTEEMGYYDPQQAAAYYAACQQQESPAEDSENPAASTTDANSSDESEDSETEVEDSDEDEQVEPKRSSSGAIQAIKSVPDVRIVTTDEDDESEPEEEEPVKQETSQLGIKQLSIIFEESDQSDAESIRRWHRRSAACTETEESSEGETEDECHTSAKEEEDDDDEDESTEEEEEDDEIEVVKSPVKLSASRSTLVEEAVQSGSEEESEEEEEEEEEQVVIKKPQVVAKKVVDEDEEEEESEEEDEEEEDEVEKEESKPPSQIIKKASSKNLFAQSKSFSTHGAEEDDSSDEDCDRKLMNSSTVVEISKTDSSDNKAESEESDEDSDDEAANATVTVRLPLRIKISPSSTNCGPVATLTVGNSEQVQSSELKANAKVEEWMQRGESSNQRGSPEVSICLSLPLRRNPVPPPENEDSHWEDDSSSTSIQTVRHRRASIASSIHSVATTQQVQTPPVDSDKERSDDYESPAPAQSPPVKIEEPKLSRVSSQTVLQENLEKPKKTSSACEKRSKRNKRRSSTEDDSGVTDLSRQISDSESEVGLDLMMLACQRAATHSRLFKLLQDAGVCSDDDEEDGDESASSDNQQKESQDVVIVPVTKPEVKPKRDTLRLPLQAEIGDSSSLSSSEITSPASPTVAAKLVRELAKELSKKKGKKSKASRIHATALRIMKEEDNDPYDTGTTGSSASSDSGGTRPSPLQPQQLPQMPQYYPAYPPHMYGPHYYDYVDYYNSWGMMDPRDYAAVPARAYRVLTQPGAGPMDVGAGHYSDL